MSFTHTVKQGESIASIAAQYNMHWKKIYEDPSNSDFRQLRPNPHVIYPGDEVSIPEKELREENRTTDQRHHFEVEPRTVVLRVVMKDIEDHVLDNCAYKLEVDEKVYKGTTGTDGLIQETLPADAHDGTLTFWLNAEAQGGSFRWSLRLSHIDPVECLTGVQARLNNLSFNAGPVDGIRGPKTEAAVRAFQKKYRLKLDGISGPITQKKLKEVYGC
jgi:hypothetical protein